jgi:hypothetical protein
VKITARVALGLSAFLLAAGLVYAFTSFERQGTVQLLVTTAAFGYVGFILWGAARKAEQVPADETPSALHEQEAEEEPVPPTIWPFGFSLAAIGIVLGVVVAHWLLIVGGVLFAVSVLGWMREVRRQHDSTEHRAASPAEGVPAAGDHEGPGA